MNQLLGRIAEARRTGSTWSGRELLFDKVLMPTDVGKLNRLVIPKELAEKHFPLRIKENNDENNSIRGMMLNFEDAEGKVWRFRYSYWYSSKSYVLTMGWSRFVKEKGLRSGDVVSFWRYFDESDMTKFLIDCKAAPAGKVPDDDVTLSSSSELPMIESEDNNDRSLRLFGVNIGSHQNQAGSSKSIHDDNDDRSLRLFGVNIGSHQNQAGSSKSIHDVSEENTKTSEGSGLNREKTEVISLWKEKDITATSSEGSGLIQEKTENISLLKKKDNTEKSSKGSRLNRMMTESSVRAKTAARRIPLLQCIPILGGSPFIICSKCCELLMVTSSMFPTSKQGPVRLQCGKCYEVLLYNNYKESTALGLMNCAKLVPLNNTFDTSYHKAGEACSTSTAQQLVVQRPDSVVLHNRQYESVGGGVPLQPLELSEEIGETKQAGSSTSQIGKSSKENNPSFSINKENSDLHESMEKFDRLGNQPINALFTPFTLQTKVTTLQSSTLVDGTPVYGRNSDKEKIIDILLSDNYSRNVTTTCIVAGGGMGKTTIAQLVYCDKGICDAFESRMFISVSENYDEKRLIKEIIEALTHVSCDITDLYKLEEIASEELGGKKFILIMDDAETMSPSFWYKIVGLLNNGAKGSTLMVTTKSTKLAGAMDADHTYHLNNLTDECCWVLFQDRIFRGNNNSDAHANLLKIVKKQIQNYWRSPLCTKMLADLLHLSVTEMWWSTISDSLMVMSEHREDFLPALGYILLPRHLKKCFMYCSLFPKNYVFSKQHLVRLWLSEGFIEPIGGKQLEKVGSEYFDDLIRRSFFEHLHICPSNDDKFAMHGSILELAEKLASDKYFRYEGCLQKAPESSSHLSVVPYEFQTISLQDLTTEMKDLRTMLFLGASRCESEDTFPPVVSIVGLNDLFKKFKGLISLDLSRTDVKELPNSIAFLTCLKYLGLNNTNIKIMPSCISELIALQTLEAKNCYYLTELPETLTKLIALRHLDVTNESEYVTMPYGIGQLTNLVSLAAFNVGSDPAHSKIEELNGLEYLQGSLLVSGIETITNEEHAKQANLQGKPDIESLTLQWGSTATYFSEEEDGEGEEKDADNAEKILENLRPNNNLEELIIRNYGGKQFPIWFEDPAFSKLVSIVLDNCCNCTMLPTLGRLPSLRYLSMNKMYIVSRMIDNSIAGEGINSIMYPSLELLNLSEMYGLEEWPERNNKDFPRLRTLVVDKCQFLKRIAHLPVLLELSLFHGDKLPEISDLPSLEYMKIEGFQKVKSIYFSCNLPALKKLEIRHCKELSTVACASKFARKLEIVGCQKLKVADYASPLSEERKPPTIINTNKAKRQKGKELLLGLPGGAGGQETEEGVDRKRRKGEVGVCGAEEGDEMS